MAKNKVSILVASVTLSLGRDKETGERNRLPKDEELTDDIVKQFGLTKKDIQTLIDDGNLVEREVRAAAGRSGGDSAALAAANAEIADLKKRLEDADADYEDLEKHVTVLEDQIKALGAEPTPKDAAAADDGAGGGAAADAAAKAKAKA